MTGARISPARAACATARRSSARHSTRVTPWARAIRERGSVRTRRSPVATRLRPWETHPSRSAHSILGNVQTFAGAPVTGFTITIYDVPVGSTPRSDVSLSAGDDGSFRARLTAFPDSEPPGTPAHHLMMYVEAPGYLRAMREVYAHPGTGVNVGVITVAARDSNTVTVDSNGGNVTDSQGLISLTIPPGALSAPTPITVTPYMHREELGAPLPTITVTGYGFSLEPSGTELAQPATVTIKNWRSLPTSVQIPVGRFDEVNGHWQHEGVAAWNGSAWSAQISHFSVHDANPSNQGRWIILADRGHDPNGGGSAVVEAS